MSDFERSVCEYLETLQAMPGPLSDDEFFDAAVAMAGRGKDGKKAVWAILKNSGRVSRESRSFWQGKINDRIK